MITSMACLGSPAWSKLKIPRKTLHVKEMLAIPPPRLPACKGISMHGFADSSIATLLR